MTGDVVAGAGEGRLERVAGGVWALPLHIPPGHMPYTLTYLIEDAAGGVHLVDPGWDLDDNHDALGRALGALGHTWGDVRSTVITHLHPDHIGLAGRVRQRYDVPVVLHRREQAAQRELDRLERRPQHVSEELARWGVPQDRLDEVRAYATKAPRIVVDGDILVDDGELLEMPGRSIRVLHTPGHTPGHICLHDELADLLFTGDHVLPTVVPGIGLGGPVDHNPLERYLDGLDDLGRFEACEVLPGHGHRFRGLGERAGQIARQHLRRTAEVARLLDGGQADSTWQTASGLTWSRGWQNLTRHYLLAALRQTEMHVRLVRDGRHVALLQRWGVSLDGNE